MMRLALCDDDESILKKMEGLIRIFYGSAIQIASFQSAFGLMTYVEEDVKGSVDIIIMDIQLHEENGIVVAKKIQDQFPQIKVIFMTGYIDYARDIFEANPVYFLTKPIEKNKLYGALEKTLVNIQDEKVETVKLTNKKEVCHIPVNDILYIESEKKRLHVHEWARTTTIQCKLPEFLELLPNSFLRCHQSYAINMDKIRSFSGTKVELQNRILVPISKNKAKEAKEEFLKYIGETL